MIAQKSGWDLGVGRIFLALRVLKRKGRRGGGTLGLSQPVYKFLHVDHDRKHFALEWRNYSALRNRST